MGMGRGREECPTLEHNARPALYWEKVMGYFNLEGLLAIKKKRKLSIWLCVSVLSPLLPFFEVHSISIILDVWTTFEIFNFVFRSRYICPNFDELLLSQKKVIYYIILYILRKWCKSGFSTCKSCFDSSRRNALG